MKTRTICFMFTAAALICIYAALVTTCKNETQLFKEYPPREINAGAEKLHPYVEETGGLYCMRGV